MRLIVAAYASLTGLAVSVFQSAVGSEASWVPQISIGALVAGAVFCGMFYQQFQDMKRRVRELERAQEEWDGRDRRHRRDTST